MNVSHFARDTWMMSTQCITSNQEFQLLKILMPMMFKFFGMQLNLFRHAIMVGKILQKLKIRCGMFCTTVMKWSNIDGMFSHISLPTFINPYITMSGQQTLKQIRYKNELTQQRVRDIDRAMRTRFADWFEKEVSFRSSFTCY